MGGGACQRELMKKIPNIRFAAAATLFSFRVGLLLSECSVTVVGHRLLFALSYVHIQIDRLSPLPTHSSYTTPTFPPILEWLVYGME